MIANAQTFWLESLKEASHYNSWVFSQLQPHLGRKVLEVGCGNGNFTVLLAQHCSSVVGVDLNSDYVRAAKRRLSGYSHATIQQTDATQMRWSQSFDTIVMLDVLEHIEDDVRMLQQLGACLKPGGKLLIKVPALECIYSQMDAVIGHYRRYNKKTLRKVLQKAYFPNPELWYFNMAGIPGWWWNGKILRRTTPPSQQVGLFNQVVPVLETVESVVKPPVGLSVFAVGRKP